MTRRNAVTWWAVFALVAIVSLGFALGVGNYVANLNEPQEMGTATVGEWMDLTEHGFRVRVDELAAAPEMPSGWTEGEFVTAPPSMELLRVRMTVLPQVQTDEAMGCLLRLYNADGEELTLTEYGVEGPEASGCTWPSDAGPRQPDVEFQTQAVYVVPASAADGAYLEIQPLYADSRVHWTVTQG